MKIHSLARLALFAGMCSLPACSSPEPVLDCSSCPPSVDQLADWEAKVLEPVLLDLRKGVRPVGDRAFGVCRGVTECEAFLGPTPGELPPGDYLLRAELAVPGIGAGWKADFHVECTSPGSAAGAPQTQDRSYDLKYMGPEHGQRLQPLWRIQSPHPSGARACTFTLTPIRPDGQKGAAMRGSYATPAPAASPTP